MNVKYSFIVPVYNIASFLPMCIDSLLAQTYKAYEVVIVDDGSTDFSGQIADRYQESYPQTVRTIHQANTGQGGARNHGVELARGEFILFVDGDDYVSPNMLEIIEIYKRKYDDDILFFEWETVKEGEYGIVGATEYIDSYKKMTAAEYVYQQPSPCRKVYKAKLFQNKELKFPEKIFYEDLALAPCFALVASSIGAIDERLYYYVQRKSSTMHSKDVNRFLDIIPAFDLIIRFFQQNQIFGLYHAELEWLAIQHVLYYSTTRISYNEYNRAAASKLLNYMNEIFPEYKKNPYMGIKNRYINYEELKALMESGYDTFDSQFYRKRRRVRAIKDFLKNILHESRTY